ncbi:MAG: hypothetical protein ACRDYY_01410 [Acidimicrobiales bacterium]
MIDATRSPRPAWKQYTTLVVLLVLIVVAGWYIWTKELHRTSSAAHPAPRPAAAAASLRLP